jgi:hypothetical protein
MRPRIDQVRRDARLRSLDEPPRSEPYLPMLRAPSVTMSVALRTRRVPAALGMAEGRSRDGVAAGVSSRRQPEPRGPARSGFSPTMDYPADSGARRTAGRSRG